MSSPTPSTPQPKDDGQDLPPAGPHARPELTDNEKTPGAGSLPEADPEGGEADAGSG